MKVSPSVAVSRMMVGVHSTDATSAQTAKTAPGSRDTGQEIQRQSRPWQEAAADDRAGRVPLSQARKSSARPRCNRRAVHGHASAAAPNTRPMAPQPEIADEDADCAGEDASGQAKLPALNQQSRRDAGEIFRHERAQHEGEETSTRQATLPIKWERDVEGTDPRPVGKSTPWSDANRPIVAWRRTVSFSTNANSRATVDLPVTTTRVRQIVDVTTIGWWTRIDHRPGGDLILRI